jgi:hypothetical protein
MKPEKKEDDIRLEPLLVLTLALLVGAAFYQGVFQEYMAKAGALAALCLLHLALIGRVRELGRIATRFVKTTSPHESEVFEDPSPSLSLLIYKASQNPANHKELALWTSGQCLSGSKPVTSPLSRL